MWKRRCKFKKVRDWGVGGKHLEYDWYLQRCVWVTTWPKESAESILIRWRVREDSEFAEPEMTFARFALSERWLQENQQATYCDQNVSNRNGEERGCIRINTLRKLHFSNKWWEKWNFFFFATKVWASCHERGMLEWDGPSRCVMSSVRNGEK